MTADKGTLREALAHALEFIEDRATDSDGMDPAAGEVVAEARAALSSKDEPLDVERLANAYNNCQCLPGMGGTPLTMKEWREIAAEYAALSKETTA